MASTLSNNDTDFEARWASAVKLAALPQDDWKPAEATEMPAYLMPQQMLEWLEEVADVCSQESLIDDARHGAFIRSIREQSSLFSAIDPDALKSILISIQTAETEKD